MKKIEKNTEFCPNDNNWLQPAMKLDTLISDVDVTDVEEMANANFFKSNDTFDGINIKTSIAFDNDWSMADVNGEGIFPNICIKTVAYCEDDVDDDFITDVNIEMEEAVINALHQLNKQISFCMKQYEAMIYGEQV